MNVHLSPVLGASDVVQECWVVKDVACQLAVEQDPVLVDLPIAGLAEYIFVVSKQFGLLTSALMCGCK
jgi:hypothetical protein